MEMTMYGDETSGYFMSTEDGGNKDQRPHLEPCPFCSHEDHLKICSTHTPYFWVECERCGAQMHSKSIQYNQDALKTRAGTRKVWGRALAQAVRGWNRRR